MTRRALSGRLYWEARAAAPAGAAPWNAHGASGRSGGSSAAGGAPGTPDYAAARAPTAGGRYERQGLPLVHFPSQHEPFL